MRKVSSLALIGFVPLVTLAAGCGGNETTASIIEETLVTRAIGRAH